MPRKRLAPDAKKQKIHSAVDTETLAALDAEAEEKETTRYDLIRKIIENHYYDRAE